MSATLSPNTSSIDNRNLNIFSDKLNLFTNKSVQHCRALSNMQRFTAALSNLMHPTLKNVLYIYIYWSVCPLSINDVWSDHDMIWTINVESAINTKPPTFWNIADSLDDQD